MPTIDNSERGCGTLKKGGFYAQGKPRPGGLLEPWTWLLGTGLLPDACTPDQPIITCPPRQVMVFNLLGSLMTGQRLQDYPEEQTGWFNQHPGIPAKALLDHVGSVHYPNPVEFAAEVVARGPSRKIPKSLAGVLAKQCPLPIVFTHSKIPMARDAVARDKLINGFIMAACNLQIEPTWLEPGFSLNSLDSGAWTETHWQQYLMAETKHVTTLTETIFGVSWITEITYVAKDDDSPDFLNDLFASGIEPVRIKD